MIPHEHEFEAEHGLPEALPLGERLLWQGSPDWRTVAIDALHARKVAIYFDVLMVWRAAAALSDGATVLHALALAAALLPLAVAAVGILTLLGWLVARTAVYTLTDRRLVMRVGIVLSVTYNLPLRLIQSASLRARRAGTGDIALTLDGPDRIAYLHLWPHARPWQLRRPQPMLRGVPDAESVAHLLADTLTRAPAAEPARESVAVLHAVRHAQQPSTVGA